MKNTYKKYADKWTNEFYERKMHSYINHLMDVPTHNDFRILNGDVELTVSNAQTKMDIVGLLLDYADIKTSPFVRKLVDNEVTHWSHNVDLTDKDDLQVWVGILPELEGAEYIIVEIPHLPKLRYTLVHEQSYGREQIVQGECHASFIAIDSEMAERLAAAEFMDAYVQKCRRKINQLDTAPFVRMSYWFELTEMIKSYENNTPREFLKSQGFMVVSH